MTNSYKYRSEEGDYIAYVRFVKRGKKTACYVSLKRKGAGTDPQPMGHLVADASFEDILERTKPAKREVTRILSSILDWTNWKRFKDARKQAA